MWNNHQFIAEKQHCLHANTFVFVTIIELITLCCCFSVFPRYVDIYPRRSDGMGGPVWWVSMWQKKNKRFDEETGMLHYFVEEHRKDVVHLHHRSDCMRGSVWWVSMRNKNNKRFDEEVVKLHYFVWVHWQDVGLLHHRSDWSRDAVWWVSMWNKRMRDSMKR